MYLKNPHIYKLYPTTKLNMYHLLGLTKSNFLPLACNDGKEFNRLEFTSVTTSGVPR